MARKRELGAIAGLWAAVATSVFIGYVSVLDLLIALQQNALVQTVADQVAHDSLVYLETDGRSDRDSLSLLVSASHTFCVFDPSHPEVSTDVANIKGDDPLALTVQHDECQPLIRQASETASGTGATLKYFALSEDLRDVRTFGGPGRLAVMVEVSKARNLPWVPHCRDDGPLCYATAYAAALELSK